MSSAGRARHLSRPLAGIALVVVAGAGLGAYFGIRAAQGSGSALSAGQPPARTGAAVAYDPADGTVVLFGGQSKSRSLDDTWIWNGSAWAQAHPKTSPPALVNAQMTYDPATHDVLLVGGQEFVGSNMGPIACSGGGGSSSSGSTSSGSSSSGSTTIIPPGNPIPAIAPAPSATVGTITATPGCVIHAPDAATWLWNGSDWKKESVSTPSTGYGSGTLATDPVSGRVLLITVGPFAEPALGAAQPAIACPMQGTAMPDAQPKCPVFPVPEPVWSWNGHAWKAIATTGGGWPSGVMGSSVIVDAVTGRLAVFGGEFIAPLPAQCPSCLTGMPVTQSSCCQGTVRVWNGGSWKQIAIYTTGPRMPGGTCGGDPAALSDVYLTSDGQTWLWTGTWKRVHPDTTPPSLSGAAATYDATTGHVVLFGGFAAGAHASGLYDQTWTWDGTTWTMRGGSKGPSVPIPIPSPVSLPPGPPCSPLAEPANMPGTPAPAPHIICYGGSGSAPGSPGKASATAPGSGVVAP